MLVSPFAFYRGAAYLMAADLGGHAPHRPDRRSCAATPTCPTSAASRRRTAGSSSASTTSTRPCPARSSGTSSGWWPASPSPAAIAGFDAGERQAVNLAVGARRTGRRCSDLAEMRALDIWYARLDVDELEALCQRQAKASDASGSSEPGQGPDQGQHQGVRQAHRGRRRRAADHLRSAADRPGRELLGRTRPTSSRTGCGRCPLATGARLPGDRRHLLERFRFVDAARKVVGVGSVGTRAWVVLMVGNDDDDPLFLQVKEAAGVGAGAVPGQEHVRQPRPAGRRGPAADAVGQRHHARLGARPTASTASTRDFYVRQLWDGKASAHRRDDDAAAADGCTPSCAAGRWRAPTPAPATPSPSRSYLGRQRRFDRAMASFAEAYADQNERDFAALRRAVDDGRVAAETG